MCCWLQATNNTRNPHQLTQEHRKIRPVQTLRHTSIQARAQASAAAAYGSTVVSGMNTSAVRQHNVKVNRPGSQSSKCSDTQDPAGRLTSCCVNKGWVSVWTTQHQLCSLRKIATLSIDDTGLQAALSCTLPASLEWLSPPCDETAYHQQRLAAMDSPNLRRMHATSRVLECMHCQAHNTVSAQHAMHIIMRAASTLSCSAHECSSVNPSYRCTCRKAVHCNLYCQHAHEFNSSVHHLLSTYNVPCHMSF
jgi:hypothetical protein